MRYFVFKGSGISEIRYFDVKGSGVLCCRDLQYWCSCKLVHCEVCEFDVLQPFQAIFIHPLMTEIDFGAFIEFARHTAWTVKAEKNQWRRGWARQLLQSLRHPKKENWF